MVRVRMTNKMTGAIIESQEINFALATPHSPSRVDFFNIAWRNAVADRETQETDKSNYRFELIVE